MPPLRLRPLNVYGGLGSAPPQSRTVDALTSCSQRSLAGAFLAVTGLQGWMKRKAVTPQDVAASLRQSNYGWTLWFRLNPA